jgi:tryptophan 2,3-dioxygenase
MRQPFAVTFKYLANTAPAHRPARMEEKTDIRTFWAKSEVWAKRIAATKLGIRQEAITSIAPLWSMDTIEHINALQQVVSNIYAAQEAMTVEEYSSIQDQLLEAIALIDAAQIRLIDQSEDLGGLNKDVIKASFNLSS